jgi:hypothetical protein
MQTDTMQTDTMQTDTMQTDTGNVAPGWMENPKQMEPTHVGCYCQNRGVQRSHMFSQSYTLFFANYVTQEIRRRHKPSQDDTRRQMMTKKL